MAVCDTQAVKAKSDSQPMFSVFPEGMVSCVFGCNGKIIGGRRMTLSLMLTCQGQAVRASSCVI